MNRLLVIVIALLLPFLSPNTWAQSDPDGRGKPARTTAQMLEDIATFRLLLNRQTQKVHGLSGVDAQDAAHRLGLAEGVYLSGRGVVFTLSVPTPGSNPFLAALTAPEKEPTPWEKAQQELRGTTPSKASQPKPTREVPFSDSLLRLLAENGHQFTQLAADESITIAVTFRGQFDCNQCHSVSNVWEWKREGTGDVHGLVTWVSRFSDNKTYPMAVARFADKTVPPPLATLTADDTELLRGDLAMKQGKYKDALNAYEDARLKLTRLMRGSPTQTASDLRVLLRLIEVQNKLAQAFVASGDAVKAQQMLKATLQLTEEAARLGNDSAQARTPRSPVPPQLIVTASKKVLDQVGTGKLTFAEFSKLVQVEYVGGPIPRSGSEPK